MAELKERWLANKKLFHQKEVVAKADILTPLEWEDISNKKRVEKARTFVPSSDAQVVE